MRQQQVRTWTGAVLGALASLLLNVAIARASDDFVMEEFHHTYPLTAEGRVSLRNINGAAHISTWDQNQVKVDAIKRASDDEELKQEEIRVDARADSIAIETKYHHNENGWHNHRAAEVEYTLTVPRNARLESIELINGGLDVIGVKGDVHASCINGTLKARDLSGAAKLSTINGPLYADFAQLAHSVELSSVNGPVHLTLPSDAKADIEAATVHGGIDNNFGLRTNIHRWVGHDLRGELGGGGTRIHLNNVNGTIDVRHANDGRAVSPAKDLNGHDDDDDEI